MDSKSDFVEAIPGLLLILCILFFVSKWSLIAWIAGVIFSLMILIWSINSYDSNS